MCGSGAYAAELEQKVEARTATLRAQAAEIEALYLKAEGGRPHQAEIVSNVSHELRTPLNIILGYNELLLRRAAARPFRPLTRCSRKVRPVRAAGRDHPFATHARGSARRKVRIVLSRFSLSALVEELRADAGPLNADKGLLLELKTASAAREVEHDREKVRTIAYHLLSNAIKFTHVGRVELALAAGDDEDAILLTVSDTGVGLAPEARALAFEDFRQLDGSSTRSFEGVGLGLGIVKRYTTLLGGTVRLESRLGEGTTVVVELPARPPDTPRVATRTRRTRASASGAVRAVASRPRPRSLWARGDASGLWRVPSLSEGRERTSLRVRGWRPDIPHRRRTPTDKSRNPVRCHHEAISRAWRAADRRPAPVTPSATPPGVG
jgi:signal transduction histidine kinase